MLVLHCTVVTHIKILEDDTIVYEYKTEGRGSRIR
jgi:hypothetical protein